MNRWARWRPWLWAAVPGAVGLVLFFGLRRLPAVAEWVFARGVFRVIAYPLGWLTSLVPWSLTETAAVLLVPLLVWGGVRLWRRWRRCACRKAALMAGARRLLAAVSALFLWYMLLHGVNFYRLPLETLLELDEERQFTAAELQEVCFSLAEEANRARESLPVDEQGHVTYPTSVWDTLAAADDGFVRLAEDYDFLAGSAWRVKPVALSYPWSYTGTSGMYFPWLGEANVNVAMPAWSVPATAAHEVAHTRGFAREDECNFLAYLACRAHPDPFYAYSGALMTYIYCANALYAHDPDLWAAVRETCSPGVVADLAQQGEFWDGFRGQVQELSSAANHAFIQSQGVDDGVLSYNRVVELVLKSYFLGRK